MKQLKYEVILTLVEGKHITDDEMYIQLLEALRQELGFMVHSVEAQQFGIFINDEPND